MNDLSRRSERYSISIKPDQNIERQRVTADSEMWRETNEPEQIPMGKSGIKKHPKGWNGEDRKKTLKRKARQRNK